MTCRDFRRKLDQWFDAETRALACGRPERGDSSGADPCQVSIDAWDPAMVDHAAGCNACQQLGVGYQLLARALGSWKRPPIPAAGWADRVLSATQDSRSPATVWAAVADRERERPWRAPRAIASLVVSCLAFALLLPAIHRVIPRSGPDGLAVRPIATQSTAGDDLPAVSGQESGSLHERDFELALAAATSATWDLAVSASEPAARISRVVLDATAPVDEPGDDRSTRLEAASRGRPAREPSLRAAGFMVSIPLLLPKDSDPAAEASAVLQQVGDHLAAGVRPLSSLARHAFGFLLGPARDQPGAPATQRATKGA